MCSGGRHRGRRRGDYITQKYLLDDRRQACRPRLRRTLYHHVQRLSLSFYEQRQTGDMVVRLTSDIDAAEDFISLAILGIVLNLLTLGGMIGVMFYLDWRFSLIGLSVAPVLFVIVYRLTRRIRPAARAVNKKESELASVVQESISSASIVKAFAQRGLRGDRLDRESQQSVDPNCRREASRRGCLLGRRHRGGGTGLVLWFGARLVLAEPHLRRPARVRGVSREHVQADERPGQGDGHPVKAAIGFEPISEILGIESQIRDRPGAGPAPPSRAGSSCAGPVRLRADRPVLDDSDSVATGQRAALVGPTGSGNSTLIGSDPAALRRPRAATS